MGKKYKNSMVIGGEEYELAFTLEACKNLTERYGSLSKIPDAFKSDDLEKAVGELKFLIMQLVNAGIEKNNVRAKEKVEPFTEDEIEKTVNLLTLEDDLFAVFSAIYKSGVIPVSEKKT